jgi:hypothetical protein
LLPRHQVHTLKNIGAGPGCLLTVILPAGFERFFAVVAERHVGDEDIDEIVAFAAELSSGNDKQLLAVTDCHD